MLTPNFFMVVGTVENVNLNSIDVANGSDHLEIICEFDLSFVKVGINVVISGTIHEDGLYAKNIGTLGGGETDEQEQAERLSSNV